MTLSAVYKRNFYLMNLVIKMKLYTNNVLQDMVIKTTLCSVHCKVPVYKNYILHEPCYQADTVQSKVIHVKCTIVMYSINLTGYQYDAV